MPPKFLLDENVRHELFIFLKNKGFDVKLPPKGATDVEVVEISKKEGRILVTNDRDFEFVSKSEVFSVILLKIYQADKEGLFETFDRLLSKDFNFEGKSILLFSNKQETSSLI